jgi:hypothetical protein
MTDAMRYLAAALADRYAVERALGAGRMAIVDLATDSLDDLTKSPRRSTRAVTEGDA